MATPARLLALSSFGVAAFLGAGCGEASERVSEAAAERALEAANGGNVDINIDDDTGEATFETEDGTLSAGQGSIPDAWPSDIPLPDLEGITSSEIANGASGDFITVLGTTDLSADEAVAFFVDALGGWTEASRMTFGDPGGRTIQLGYELDGRELLVGIVEDGSTTTLSLSHSATT